MQMVIASRLSDGRVVFLGDGGRWVESIVDGLIVESQSQAATLLETARDSVDAAIVVDPYVIDVSESSRGRRPASLREAIRAFGPSVGMH